jgi:hypothetical protein
VSIQRGLRSRALLVTWAAALALVGTTGCSGSANPRASESSSPQQVWSDFKAALARGDGEKATQLLAEETFVAYEKYRRAALTTTAAELEELSTADVCSILAIRYAFSKEELASSTGRSLVVKAVVRDLNSGKALDRVEVGEIAYSEDVAIAKSLHRGKPSPDVLLTFRKQGGSWKWDLQAYGQQAADRFDAMRRKQKLGKAEFALRLLREQYGDRVFEEIVNRPRD